MIERFNFYDVYGYLIPGLVLVLTLTLPFAITGRYHLAAGEWPALIIGVVIAYIVGHLVQSMATTAIPSSRDHKREKWKYPSALMLNPNDTTFSGEVKTQIEKSIRSWFGLEVKVSQESSPEIGGIRQDAFYLCRRVVNEVSNYAEQFEGLYTMMRGVTVALWLASSYTVGWVVSPWHTQPSLSLAVVGFITTLLAFAVLSVVHFTDLDSDTRMRVNIASIILLGLALLSVGYILGITRSSPSTNYVLIGAIILYVGASFRFFNAYRFFAKEFAKSVWLQFAAEPTTRPSK